MSIIVLTTGSNELSQVLNDNKIGSTRTMPDGTVWTVVSVGTEVINLNADTGYSDTKVLLNCTYEPIPKIW